MDVVQGCLHLGEATQINPSELGHPWRAWHLQHCSAEASGAGSTAHLVLPGREFQSCLQPSPQPGAPPGPCSKTLLGGQLTSGRCPGVGAGTTSRLLPGHGSPSWSSGLPSGDAREPITQYPAYPQRGNSGPRVFQDHSAVPLSVAPPTAVGGSTEQPGSLSATASKLLPVPGTRRCGDGRSGTGLRSPPGARSRGAAPR